MSFVHLHAPHATPSPTDVCLVIDADRLLAGAETTAGVRLPEYSAVVDRDPAAWPPLHVGLLDGRPCWLLQPDPADAMPTADWQWHETRALLGLLTPEQSHAISCARQLLWWDRRHRHCGVCGAATLAVIEERARRCPSCDALFFPVASPAVIVAVTRGDKLLLAHNRAFRVGMFSLLAGFVDPGETLEQAVVREVREEVGIAIDDLTYVASQPWAFPNSLMIGFRARHVSGELVVDGKEIEEAGWFDRRHLPDIPRAGTVARLLIDRWLQE